MSISFIYFLLILPLPSSSRSENTSFSCFSLNLLEILVAKVMNSLQEILPDPSRSMFLNISPTRLSILSLLSLGQIFSQPFSSSQQLSSPSWFQSSISNCCFSLYSFSSASMQLWMKLITTAWNLLSIVTSCSRCKVSTSSLSSISICCEDLLVCDFSMWYSTHSCLRISLACNLRLGSRTISNEIRCLASMLIYYHYLALKLRLARLTCCRVSCTEWPLKGNLPTSITNKSTPSDHRSHQCPQRPSNTSGAQYSGVPHFFISYCTEVDPRPQSISFIQYSSSVPWDAPLAVVLCLLTRIFSGLMSRCTIECAWMQATALQISAKMSAAFLYVNFFSMMISSKSYLPSKYSVMIIHSVSVSKYSQILSTLGWSNFFRIYSSLQESWLWASGLLFLITFNARTICSYLCVILNTSPKEPSPILSTYLYLSQMFWLLRRMMFYRLNLNLAEDQRLFLDYSVCYRSLAASCWVQMLYFCINNNEGVNWPHPYKQRLFKSAVAYSNPMIKCFIVTLTLHFLVLPILCKQIEVPALTDSASLDIKIGHIEQANLPGFNFSRVYSRKVYTPVNYSLVQFEPCRQNRAEVTFQVTDELVFKGRPAKPTIIYKIDDIKYSQFLLDVLYDGNTIYMMFEDGQAAVSTIDTNKQIASSSLVQVEGMEPGARLEVGYFVKLGARIVFVNNAYAIEVGLKNAKKLSGYAGGSNFETVVAINQRVFAVAYEQTGVSFYNITDSTVTLVSQLQAAQIDTSARIQLSDLAYDTARNQLLVLDQKNGLLSYSLRFTDQQITPRRSDVTLKRQLCSMMHLHASTLYLVCKQVYKISLEQWPRLTEQTIAHPRIKVREVFAEGDVVVFVGRNIFRLVYLDKVVHYYQDQVMDKLLLTNGLFVSANEGGLMVGTYNIFQNYITCQTHDPKMTGIHPLIFKTIAQCNSQFLASHNIDLGTEATPADTCIYTVNKDIYFWKTGEVRVIPMIVAMLVVVLTGLSVGCVWMFKKFSIRRAQRELAEYTAMVAGKDEGKHKELVEEEDGESANEKSGASNQVEELEVENEGAKGAIQDTEGKVDKPELHDIE